MRTFLKSLISIFIFLWASISFIIALMMIFILVRVSNFPYPKKLNFKNLISKKIITKNGKKFFGKNWISKSNGITEMYLEGTHDEVGYAHGILAANEVSIFDDELMGQFNRLIKNPIAKFLVGFIILFKFNGLENHISNNLKKEIRAFSLSYNKIDKYKHLFDTYPRILYYHAIHDIGQYMMQKYRIGGCSSFAVNSKKHGLILGRNFDFEAGKIFDKRKAIIYYKIKNKIPFVSISWPGMMGVVSGMNAKKIAVIMNAAGTDDHIRIGSPTSIIVREIMESASSLNEAINIINKSKVFVSDTFLVIDGKTGEMAAIERSPTKISVIKSKNNYIGITNHFRSKIFKNDKVNIDRIKYLTTLARYKRLDFLLKKYKNKISPNIAVKILRDRRYYTNEELAPGNRNAINAIIASHSIVFVPNTGSFFVGQAPNTLGKYVHFNLYNVINGKRIQHNDIQADSFLTSGKYKKYMLYKKFYKLAQNLYKSTCLNEAYSAALKAFELNRKSPELLFLIINILNKLKKSNRINYYKNLYLNAHPPYLKNIEIIKRISRLK